MTNNISRPQSRIYTEISNSSSEQFFFCLTYLLSLFCIVSVSPFFHIKTPGLWDTGYIGLQHPKSIHLFYPTLYTQRSQNNNTNATTITVITEKSYEILHTFSPFASIFIVHTIIVILYLLYGHTASTYDALSF